MCAFRGCERREICWGRNCSVQPLLFVSRSFFDFFVFLLPGVFSCVLLFRFKPPSDLVGSGNGVDVWGALCVEPLDAPGAAVCELEKEEIGFLV